MSVNMLNVMEKKYWQQVVPAYPGEEYPAGGVEYSAQCSRVCGFASGKTRPVLVSNPL
jgi:hypothetical protein